MARTVKEEEYAARRDEILDVAQCLVASRGYERLTMRDIMGEMKVSKGALYHYFISKQAMLEALVERMIGEAEQLSRPILDDPRLPALDKLNHFFSAQDRLKLERQPMMLAILRVWYADDNAIVRQKVRALMLKRMKPLLATVIRQGVEEGVFTARYPDEAGEILCSLLQDLADSLAGLLLSLEPDHGSVGRIEHTLAAYTDAVERALGAPPGSLVLADPGILRTSAAFLTEGLERQDGEIP